MAKSRKPNAARHAGAVVENDPRQQPLFPGMGGTTGGERERDSERVILTAFSYQPGLWPKGGPTEPEEFWVHWDSDTAVQAAQAWNDAIYEDPWELVAYWTDKGAKYGEVRQQMG